MKHYLASHPEIALPPIGGGVTLIGRPTAAAVPVTPDLMDAYDAWLFMERRLLCIEKYGRERAGEGERFIPCNTLARDFHFPSHPLRWQDAPQPPTRAAVIFSAVGVPIGGAA